MIADLLSALAASSPALALKGSFWAYPLVNAAHILGLALLIGAIVPLDLRILGLLRDIRLSALARGLVPVAATGLALAASTGFALFMVKPIEYAGSQLFLGKIAVICVGLINVAWVRAHPLWAEIIRANESQLNATEADLRLKIAALVSLLAWLAVLLLGRLIGYFI